MKFETLIIDDDPIFILIAKRIIVSAGFHPSPLSFTNGKLAMDYLHKEENPETNYAIFLDINMPVMNGWEFLDAINLSAMKSRSHVLMITSSCSSMDRAKTAKYSNVIKYFEKPITKEEIIKLFELAPFKELIK